MMLTVRLTIIFSSETKINADSWFGWFCKIDVRFVAEPCPVL